MPGILTPEIAESLIVLWVMALSAAIGSFLNVVIYRLPAGKNIIWPGSHCPLCQHPIRWFDNIPVLSWIWLRGHCRDCRAPISIRYPLVEAGTAGLGVLLAIHELVRYGANLPGTPAGSIAGLATSGRTLPQLLGIFLYHAALLCTLMTAALIAYDGRRLPRRLLVPVLAVGLLAPLRWPGLHPVPAWPALTAGPLAGVIDGLAGLIAGALLGMLASLPARRPSGGAGDLFAPEGDLRGGCACVGVILGWQAVVALAFAALAAHSLFRLATRRQPALARIPALAWLGLATLVWILAWASLVQGAALL